jgi:vacuolar-type H+-ATPase subunit F/Vma7
MALLANDGKDRAEQLLLLTDRLIEYIAEETRRIDAREPPLEGAAADEKNRMANAYRLELARIKQDRTLLEGAPQTVLDQLKKRTTALHEHLAQHEMALGAVKLITEGLVQAMAEEIARQRGGAAGYGAQGTPQAPVGPIPTIIDRSA